MGVEHLKHNTWLQMAAWCALVCLLWSLDLVSKFSDARQFSSYLDDFRLIAEQVTSGVAVLCALPIMAWYTKRYSPDMASMQLFIVALIVGSFGFAFLHFNLIVAFRALIYPWFDERYYVTFYWSNLWQEYLKDIKIYLAIWLIMWLYRLWLGEKQTDASSGSEPWLRVQTGRGDKLVRYQDIVFLEASKNYVSVHLHDSECLVRQTMESLDAALPETMFFRCHRSYIVNLESIAQRKLLAGQHKLVLKNGVELPLGRKYKPLFDALAPTLGSQI